MHLFLFGKFLPLAFFTLLLSFVLTEEDNPGKWIHPHPEMRDLALRRDFHTLVKYPPVREV